MLAVSGGRIALLSTPFGKRGAFYDAWANGGPFWHRVKITADQCPRILSAWLDQERASIPAWWFAQEYMCEFMDAQGALFAQDDVMAALFPIAPQEPRLG